VGFLPCYWGTVPDGLAISTHLATLVSLGVSADVDERGLVEYLTLHHPLGTRTLLRDAQMLAAGGEVGWRPGTPVTTDCRPIFLPTDDPLTDDDVVDAFAETWSAVVADAVGGPGVTALGLSGGLDSRAIAETAVRQGIQPVTY